MKKLLMTLLCLSLSGGAHAFEWQKPVQPPGYSNLVSLTSLEKEGGARRVFVASENQIFEQESPNTWKTLWAFEDTRLKIKKITSHTSEPFDVFILTTQGLYKGHLLTKTLRRIFFGLNEQENNLYALAFHPTTPDLWALGSQKGLYLTRDGGKKWRQLSFLKQKNITSLLFTSDHLVLAADHEIFLTRDYQNFTSVFSLSDAPEDSPLRNHVGEGSFFKSPSLFQSMAASEDFKNLWAATSRGVIASHDGGRSWFKLPTSGLQSHAVRSLFYAASGKLYAASADSVYEYSAESSLWKNLYQGLGSGGTLDLAETESSRLALLSSHSFYLGSPSSLEVPFLETTWNGSQEMRLQLDNLFLQEPAMQELHREVIHYNDLKRGKISRWHQESRLRALLPDVSFGQDSSRGNNIDLDRGSTSVPDAYIRGPDDFNEGWDFNVSWDLGNLIWSSAQTSIDSRSKSLVDLRRDVLSETTRLYFERRRIQKHLIEMPFFSPEEHFEKVLRMKELTALLDSLSGGWFSERVRHVYEEFPELEGLWAFQKVASE